MTNILEHPLMIRLTNEMAYPVLNDKVDLENWLSISSGFRCVFAPGDIVKNLETADACVILPELRQAFQNAFECAVAAPDLDEQLRQETKAYKAPGFLFYRDGIFVDAVSKIRDWDEYMARIAQIITRKAA